MFSYWLTELGRPAVGMNEHPHACDVNIIVLALCRLAPKGFPVWIARNEPRCQFFVNADAPSGAPGNRVDRRRYKTCCSTPQIVRRIFKVSRPASTATSKPLSFSRFLRLNSDNASASWVPRAYCCTQW
jgi:hypothetical protein